MDNVLVSAVRHVFQRASNLVAEDVAVDVGAFFIKNAGDAELDVWDVVLAGLDEDGHDQLSDLVFHHEGHDGGERADAAHAVVVTFLVLIVHRLHLGDEFVFDPAGFEFFSQLCDLLDTSHSN